MANTNENLEKAKLLSKPLETLEDRDELELSLFEETARIDQEVLLAKKLAFEKEERKFQNNESFSLYNLNQDYEQFIAEVEMNYEPKFSLFLTRLGNLCNWTEEEKRSYRKPRIAAITIIEVIYKRFPNGLLDYIKVHNRYIGFFQRRTKNYKLLNEDGILKLEKYIDEANTMMASSKNYYDFRKLMHDSYGTGYQTQLFD